jgi:ankyrin repeat protein
MDRSMNSSRRARLQAGHRKAGLYLSLVVLMTTVAGGQTPNLREAARAGNVQAVRALLQKRVDVNVSDADGTTALHWAVRGNNVDIVNALLRARANTNAANSYGMTPLILAATNGNPIITQALLVAGADPNKAASRGQTPLMTAARTGNAATVKALLDKGAKVDAREDVLGEQALMWAAGENQADVVTLLLARGADVNARSNALKFPKDSFGLEGVLTSLPKGDWPALMYAARDGAPEAARALAKGGADLNAVDPEGTTALVRAIINSHYDTAAVLIEEGANPNIADGSGMAALYAAVDMSSLGEIYGMPPRHVTDKHSVLDLIEMLLAKGADVNAKLKRATLMRNHTPGEGTLGDGATALMRAAKNGDYRAMEILLKHGADVSLKQRQGATALLFACGFGRGQSAFAEDVGTEAELFKAVQLLVEKGADVKVNNDQGGTVMHFAAQSGLNSVVKYLAGKGAVLDQKDKQGRTPVDVANGVGGRGRAGGPPVLHKDTAALIQQLIEQRPAQ